MDKEGSLTPPEDFCAVEDSQNGAGKSHVTDSSVVDLVIKSSFIKKHKGIFENYYDYVGHVPNSEKFQAICKACKLTDKLAKHHNFDHHNVKSNAKRHYKMVHPNIEWKEPTTHHLIGEFYPARPTASKLTDKDPFQKKINTCYLDLICVDGLPLSVTNGIGFQNLMHTINPRLRVTKRSGLSNILHERVINMVRPVLIAELKDLRESSLHLSTDIWTTRGGDGVIAVRGQYVVEQIGSFTMKQQTLGLRKFNERHLATNIREIFTEILHDCKVGSAQVGYIVTDAAKNMVAAFKDYTGRNIYGTQIDGSLSEDEEDLQIEMEKGGYTVSEDMEDEIADDVEIDEEIRDMEFTVTNDSTEIGLGERISCFSHALQLVVNDSFKTSADVRSNISKVKKIVRFFNKSTFWKNKLRLKVSRGLVQPAPTRWSSYYHTVERISEEEVYKAVMQTLIEAKSSKDATAAIKSLPCLPARADLLELAELLHPIATATDALQGNQEIAKSEANQFSNFKISLLQSIKRRFEQKLQDKFVILAAVLDPRQKLSVFDFKAADFRNIHFETPDASHAQNVLRQEFIKLIPKDKEMSAAVKEKKTDMFSKLGSTISGSHENSLDALKEIQKYLVSDRETDLDPLAYWFQNKRSSPVLSRLAKHYLSIPASSGDVERVFSVAGAIARARRSRITPKTLEDIILFKEYRNPILSLWRESQLRIETQLKRKLDDEASSTNGKNPKNELQNENQ